MEIIERLRDQVVGANPSFPREHYAHDKAEGTSGEWGPHIHSVLVES